MRLKEAQQEGVIRLPTGGGRLDLCCVASLRYEQKGEYEAAVGTLSAFWSGPGVRPDVSGMDDASAAGLLLRTGNLTAVLGSQRQIEGWQEKAKDMLSEAASLAEASGNTDAWLSAQKDLGMCYWREGCFAEARIVTEAAIARSTLRTDLGLTLRLNLALIERSEKHYEKALTILSGIAKAVKECDSDYVKGMFYNGRALTHKGMGALDPAVMDLTACCYHFERAEHNPYLIAAQINLANWLVETKCFDEAHLYLDRAERLAEDRHDSIHLAHAHDSRARAYIAQRDYPSAELAAQKAVEILDQGDEYGLLVDFLVTLGRAQAGADHREDSLRTYFRAYGLAGERVSAERAARVALEMISMVAGEICLTARVGFEEVNHKFQESVFRAALESTDGRVNEAAMKLGMTQQGLSWHLNNRYSYLRTHEKRKKSIIRHSFSVVKSPKH